MANLVILAPNWLGDAVMALPAIADVLRAQPDARVTVAARPSVAPLFRLVPDVDDHLTLERRWRDALGALARGGFDTAILLPNSFQSALLVSKARIPERWGYRTDWRGRLLTRAIDRPSGLHQVDFYRQLVSQLGFANGSAEPRVVVSADARSAAGELLMQAGWDGCTPLVAIAPGAAYGGAKRWRSESFSALAEDLVRDGISVVVVGSAADIRTAASIVRTVRVSGPERAALLNLVGLTDLSTLAGVFAQCRTLVTNDSGAMHLAAAAGTPVTALFGPTDERATRPLGSAHRIIIGDAWCRPCMLRECPIDHHCMHSIDVPSVSAAARRFL